MIYETSQRFIPIYKNGGSPEPPAPAVVPLTFTAKGYSGNAIQLYKIGSPNAIDLKYSKNGGAWTTYNWNGTYGKDGDIITLNQNETVAFSGANDHFSKHYTGYDNSLYQFRMSGTIDGSGNIMSLMNFSDTCTSACFTYLFSGCASLRTPPLLSAINLAPKCYTFMFKDCSNLTGGPTLPATTLAEKCYSYMFQYCSKLSNIEVAFTTWGYTEGWMNGVSNTGTFTKPTALPENVSIDYIPAGWTVVNK